MFLFLNNFMMDNKIEKLGFNVLLFISIMYFEIDRI